METFVVRVWLPSENEPGNGSSLMTVRGFLEHVASGKSSAFAGTAELEALILSALHSAARIETASSATPWLGPKQG
jgi:hypothetical protein